MCKAYMQIAEGLKMMAAGYEALAKAGEHTSVSNTSEGGEVVAQREDAKQNLKQEPKQGPKSEPKPEVTVSIEDIRAAMRAKNKEGKLEKCQAVLREFGAVKLSDIPEEKYAELMAKVEVL